MFRPPPRSFRRRRWILGIGLAAAVLAAGAGAWTSVSRLVSDPGVPLLISEAGAGWILNDDPFLPNSVGPGSRSASFRKSFQVRSRPARAELVVRAFRSAAVSIDSRPVPVQASCPEDWKRPRRIDVSGFAAEGAHEILIRVANTNAPPALLAYSEELGIRTGEGWESSLEGISWAPARIAGEPRVPEISRHFPPAPSALIAKLPSFIPLFAAVFLASLFWPRIVRRLPGLAGMASSPRPVRWMLLLAWGALAANSLFKVPADLGFDSAGHLAYIRHVAGSFRIPLPGEGWQMFQSPLYYLVSAPFYSLFSALFDPLVTARLLRIVPLFCGAAQVELCYRALRRAFPARPGLQVMGTILGGLLPMNLYLSQGLGNEPLAALLSGVSIIVVLSLIAPSGSQSSRERLLLLGALLGLALLAKASALLLLPPAIAFLVPALRSQGERRVVPGIAMVLAVAFLVSGWYYLRNWIAVGSPFMGGWDPGRGILWCQDPGFRTPDQLLRFGEAFVHPIYSAACGFWDGLYSTFWADGLLSGMVLFRPPWNYGFLLSGVLLAGLPSALILLGTMAGPFLAPRPSRRILLFCAACMALFLAALIHLFLTIPIYSTVKATYASGLTVCFAIAGSAGIDLFAGRRIPLALVHGGLACWAAASYLSYFPV